MVFLLLGGCGRWAVERQELETAELIDARLAVGMTLQEFDQAFPTAQKLDAGDGVVAFLVTELKTCFWCYSGDGFVHSMDSFARVVRFADGTLVSIEPLKTGGEQ
jgi:hypothetical protein